MKNRFLPQAWLLALFLALVPAWVSAEGQAPRIGKLYWVGGNQLWRANPDGSAAEVLVSDLEAPDGLVLDLLDNKVYWTNMGRGPNGSLQRAQLDGTPVAGDSQYLVAPGTFETGKEIEFDPIANKLYWADRDGAGVMRADRDGSNVEIFVQSFIEDGQQTLLENPVGIALDLAQRQVYFTDRFMARVMRAPMDVEVSDKPRRDVHTLIRDDRDHDRPIDIDLDLAEGFMYWTDRGSHRITRARLDGSGEEVIVDNEKIEIKDPIGISLDLAQGKMYWSDMTTHWIYRANLDGSQIEKVIGGEKILNDVSYGPLGVSYVTLEPKQGPASGGQTVAVMGEHFVKGSTWIELGGTRVPAEVHNSNLLTFATPAGKGETALTIITPVGSTRLDNAYTYQNHSGN